MTILFSDIRSFTTLSEKMSPQENFNFINGYLKEIGPIIREHSGFIDKYIGDAIMALFTSADDAVKAAIAIVKIQQHQGIKAGIGLNTGKLMLGIIGEKHRLQGTVIGDAVNLASRIENITKTYNESVILSQNTLNHLKDPVQYAIRFLDNIKVKGRTERINIFEAFDGDIKEVRDNKLATLDLFEEAIYLYQIRKFSKSLELILECLQKNPYDAAAEVYHQRCQNFLTADMNENWEKITKVPEWTPDLAVDNQIIDEQHKELFVRIRNLVMSIGCKTEEEELGEIINFLESYVIVHFATEEKYMKQYNYPDYAIHKAQHTKFLENFNKIKEDYNQRRGYLYLTLKIQNKITDWLIHHIGKLDKKLGLFLKDKK